MMRMLSCLLFFALTLSTLPVNAEKLTIYTEEFPPFNFTRSGKITGVSTEVVQKVMAEAGFKVTIKSLPWSETYKRAQKQENAFIYSISRRKNREKLFKWVGIVSPTTYSALALKSRNDIKIRNLAEMKKFKVGTTVDDVMETFLTKKGFALTDFTRVSGKKAALKNFKKLLNKQIDVWPNADALAFFIAREQGHSNPDALFKKAFFIDELSGGYYLAASPSTSDAVIARVDAALKKFKRSDDYYKILAHWGVDAMGLKTSAPIKRMVYSLKHFKRVSKIGYLANDKLSAHKAGGLYRKEIREQFVELYAKTFNQWQEKFLQAQGQVDVLIIGDVSGIRGWNKTKAKQFVINQTTIPTSCVLDGLADYAFIAYEGNDLVLNQKIAGKLRMTFPKSYLNKAARIIE